MSVATAPAPPRSVPRVAEQDPTGPYRLSLAQYHAMIAAGVLGEDNRVELLDGYLTARMSTNPPHAAAVYRCSEWLRGRTDREQTFVFTERPITLPPASEPEPDVAAVVSRADFYTSSHPKPADVSLVVEVADDSLTKGRTVKQRIYAEAGILEYWIVNLRARQLERYTQPRPARPEVGQLASYAEAEVVRAGETYDHPTYGELAVDELLPVTGAE